MKRNEINIWKRILKLPFVSFFIILLMAAFSFDSKPENEIEFIKYGTSFGFCKGYCFKELTITKEKIYVHQIWWQKGKRDTINYPDKRAIVINEIEDWNLLNSKINKDIFNNLPSIIGCPDCDDGGSEWMEISRKGNIRKVTFEYGKSINQINDVLQELRLISIKYFDK